MARRKRQQGKAPSRRASGRLRDTFVSQAQGDGAFTPYNVSKEPYFSLRDEARNTERHQSYWSSDTKLRHNKVRFVSASTASPVKEPSEEIIEGEHGSSSTSGGEITQSSHALAHLNLQPTAESMISSMDDDVNIVLEKHDDDATASEVGHPMLPFVVDTVGCAASTVPILPSPVIRSPSPNPSLLSSEDEVVFKGRSTVKKIDEPVRTVPSGAPAAPSSQVEENSHLRPAWDDTPVSWVSRSTPGVGWLDKAGRGKKSKKRRTARTVEEDEVVADYLANIREQEGYDALHDLNGQSVFHRRDLSLADGDAWTDESDASVPGMTHQPYNQDGWDRLMLEDFDNLSTSREMSGVIERILSKRDRQHGPQYLVVYEGLTVDDAKWIPGALMISPNDLELIKSFEETSVREYRDISDSEDESIEDDVDVSDEDGGDVDELESLLDEDDLIRRKIDRMTDEKIARLLAKQEELGLGSDELLIFDADDGNDVDEDEDNQAELTLSALLRPSYRNKQKRRRLMAEFPSATLFADVLEQDPYNGFDIMDHERPSLKKKSKGRRGQLPFELSDEELQENLQSTWEADRRKKKIKKQEREELRAQGLLGKRNKFKPDLQAKYKEGMTLVQIREEVQQFLLSTHDSHALPPMDKKDRKVVHEIASAFNLKSKSVGSGKSRFPTLIKTSRTKDFDDRIFTTVEKRLMRGFLPRLDARGKKPMGSFPNRGGAGSAAVRYRDGDVVGGAAPEIGADNRGRAMLEKMGWSSGTALGALNNKGILQPVTHVVKTSKAGLG